MAHDRLTRGLRVRHKAARALVGEHVPGLAGPLTVAQLRGGQSNPTYKLTASNGDRYLLDEAGELNVARRHALRAKFFLGYDIGGPSEEYEAMVRELGVPLIRASGATERAASLAFDALDRRDTL